MICGRVDGRPTRQRTGDLWVRFPVLARLVGTLTADWVDRCDELISRAVHDAVAIGELAGLDRPQLVRAHIEVRPAPRHRSVTRCTFIDGSGASATVMYKPKDVMTEAVFSAFVAWMDGQVRAWETAQRPGSRRLRLG